MANDQALANEIANHYRNIREQERTKDYSYQDVSALREAIGQRITVAADKFQEMSKRQVADAGRLEGNIETRQVNAHMGGVDMNKQAQQDQQQRQELCNTQAHELLDFRDTHVSTLTEFNSSAEPEMTVQPDIEPAT